MSEAALGFFVFLFGAVAYVLLEFVWRGRSHWSMALAGGASLWLLYGVFPRLAGAPLLVKCLVGAVIIAAVEFVCGAVVNRYLGLGVWDYSGLRYHLYGQVCLRYFLLWALLCIPISAAIDALALLR